MVLDKGMEGHDGKLTGSRSDLLECPYGPRGNAPMDRLD